MGASKVAPGGEGQAASSHQNGSPATRPAGASGDGFGRPTFFGTMKEAVKASWTSAHRLSADWYRDLPALKDFQECMQESSYHKAPADWWIVMCDVMDPDEDSPDRPEGKRNRYREINTVSAGSISIAQQAMPKVDFPSTFAGGGSTILVPPDKIQAVKKGMKGLIVLARVKFELHLRVGCIHIKELHDKDLSIMVAKHDLCAGKCHAMIKGPGIEEAWRLFSVGRERIPEIFRKQVESQVNSMSSAGFRPQSRSMLSSRSPTDRAPSMMAGAIMGSLKGRLKSSSEQDRRLSYEPGMPSLHKAEEPAPEEKNPYLLEAPEDKDVKGDVELEGLSCRWQPIKSTSGVILSLVVQAKEGKEQEAYNWVLKELEDILSGNPNAGNPVVIDTMQYKSAKQILEDERRYSLRPRFLNKKWRARVVEIYLAVWLFKKKRGINKKIIDPKKYAKSMETHADYRKLHGGLQMVLDCTMIQKAQIAQVLQDGREKGLLDFGVHLSDSALMTCLLQGTNDGEHIHYIDGNDGGVTQAKKTLRESMMEPRKALSSSTNSQQAASTSSWQSHVSAKSENPPNGPPSPPQSKGGTMHNANVATATRTLSPSPVIIAQ